MNVYKQLLDGLNAMGAGITDLWVCDTEFIARDGDKQQPVCVVFHNPVTSETIRQFFLPNAPYPACPIDTSKKSLFVAYACQAELLTFIELGWKMPQRILDLFTEWRAINNEDFTLKSLKTEAIKAKKDGTLSPLSLLGVCAKHGIHTRSAAHKEDMRDLILRGFPYTSEEESAILDYCEDDVKDTSALLGEMLPKIATSKMGLKGAIYRGSSARGFAWAQHVGIPLDVDMLLRLQRHWDNIFDALYEDVKRDFPVFNPDSYDIAPKLWLKFLTDKGYIGKWPLTPGGKQKANRQPKRDKETLDTMSTAFPEFKALFEIINIRACTKLGLKFPYGRDNRSRIDFRDYGTVTGRCAPSSSIYVLAGGSPAFRHLVKPEEGKAVIEADWSQQEVWIAAYLSGDRKMQEMLRSGDAYVAFGALAGLMPADATKSPKDSPYPLEIAQQHAVLRERLKAVALGVLYGKTEFAIAKDCAMSVEEAKHLLRVHHRLFPVFWRWIDRAVNDALASRQISTKFGWTRYLKTAAQRQQNAEKSGGKIRSVNNSLQNFPMQAHGGEMLRLAMTGLADRGVGVCAPLHDAVFAVCDIADIDATKVAIRECMDAATVAVINVPVPVDVHATAYPDRFVPSKKENAVKTWARMMELLDYFESRESLPQPINLEIAASVL